MACLSRSSYTKRAALNRLRLVYKRSISFTKLASCVQKWRFVYKYVLFNLQTSISSYKLASRITTQLSSCLRYGMASSKFEISKILSDILGKKLNDNDIMNISIDEHLSNIVGHIRTY